MSETGVPKEVRELIASALHCRENLGLEMGFGSPPNVLEHHRGHCADSRASLEAAIERQLLASQEGRGREVRAMQAFIEAIWHKVMCSGETFEQAQDALVKAWTALDKSLGVWYWDHQPGALKPSIAPSGQPAVLPSGDPERTPT